MRIWVSGQTLSSLHPFLAALIEAEVVHIILINVYRTGYFVYVTVWLRIKSSAVRITLLRALSTFWFYASPRFLVDNKMFLYKRYHTLELLDFKICVMKQIVLKCWMRSQKYHWSACTRPIIFNRWSSYGHAYFQLCSLLRISCYSPFLMSA